MNHDTVHGCGCGKIDDCSLKVPQDTVRGFGQYTPPHLKHCDTPTIPGKSFVARPEYPKTKPLTYLASPYSHPNGTTRRARFELAAHAAAWLIRVKVWNVFAPIVHSHPLAEIGGLQGDWGFWEKLDREYLACSERLVVLEIDGWRQSVGVQAEIKIARELGIPVEYIRDCNVTAGEYQLSPVPMLTMDEAIKANPGDPIFPNATNLLREVAESKGLRPSDFNEPRDQRIKRMVDEQKCEEILARMGGQAVRDPGAELAKGLVADWILHGGKDSLGQTAKEETPIDKFLREAVGPTSKADTANPKDIIGATKVSLSKVPAVAIAHEAHAMMDGARKYDAYNWRAKAVQASIYVDAALRHIHDWNEGEEDAPDSKAHHLGHARACLGILLDCQENGCLIDDRPITDKSRGVMTRVLARLAEKVKQMPPLK